MKFLHNFRIDDCTVSFDVDDFHHLTVAGL